MVTLWSLTNGTDSAVKAVHGDGKGLRTSLSSVESTLNDISCHFISDVHTTGGATGTVSPIANYAVWKYSHCVYQYFGDEWPNAHTNWVLSELTYIGFIRGIITRRASPHEILSCVSRFQTNCSIVWITAGSPVCPGKGRGIIDPGPTTIPLWSQPEIIRLQLFGSSKVFSGIWSRRNISLWAIINIVNKCFAEWFVKLQAMWNPDVFPKSPGPWLHGGPNPIPWIHNCLR